MYITSNHFVNKRNLDLIESNLLIFKFILISIRNQLFTLQDKLKLNITLTFLTFYAQREQTISIHYSHSSTIRLYLQGTLNLRTNYIINTRAIFYFWVVYHVL